MNLDSGACLVYENVMQNFIDRAKEIKDSDKELYKLMMKAANSIRDVALYLRRRTERGSKVVDMIRTGHPADENMKTEFAMLRK